MSKTLRSIGAALCLTAALAMSLGGCADRDDATDEILERLDTMQREIEDLRSGSTGSSSNADSSSGDDASGTDSSGDTTGSTGGSDSGTTYATPTDEAGFDEAISDLESRVADAVATADAVTVPSSPADRPQAYFDATRPLEALDDEVDWLDDQVETAHRSHSIDRNTMWTMEDRLDVIDDQIDRAKDSLERRMGVDD
ncbi:MAG TPA: hypothetical protein K8V31_03485 [Bifidobacterium pullorum]|nr:hypothetical protein [Bifidobacterium pullorum]